MSRLALRRTWIAMVGGGLLVLLSAGLVTPSVAAAPTSVYVVQGLPGRTVSVAIDGKTVADGLAGEKVAGPFTVKKGTRTVTFAEGGKTLVTRKVRLPAGSSSEIVVHLPASPSGDPVITRFPNRFEAIPEGKAAYSVVNVAAVGPIDVRVGKRVLSANLASGEYTYKVVPAGTSSIEIVSTGMTDPLLGPFRNRLADCKMTWLFVVGVPGKDLAIIRHVEWRPEAKSSDRPEDVHTGTGGQAARLAAAGGS